MKIYSILLSLLLTMFFSCDSKKTINTGLKSGLSTGEPVATTTGTTSAGAVSCTGTSDDGYNDQVNNPAVPSPTPLFQYEVNLAGTFGWMVGNNLTDNFPNIEDAVQALSNDGPYYIRVKVLPSVKPPAGEEFCPGRLTGVAWMENYTKLGFNIYRHSYAVQFDDNFQVIDYFPLTGEAGLYVTTTDLVKENSCSDIIKINPYSVGSLPNGYTTVTLFEIKNVRSDAQHRYCNGTGTCASPEIYDPAYEMRRADCWRATVQVSTNRTHFFKGSTRN